MTNRQIMLMGFLLLFSLMQTGCANFNRKLKNILSGGSSPAAMQERTQKSTLTKFSDGGEVSPRVRRQYKRTTKETLADASALEARSGSLWVMEGQGAYLFSQNVVRMIGDPLAVNLEGDPKDQLQSKVGVINKLLAKIEERQKARLRGPAREDADAPGEGKDDKAQGQKEKSDGASAQQAQEKREEADSKDFNVKTVPTRIVERTLDGNYRVKGSQPFMIKNREYKVIVTGIVRAEDFTEEGIPASKLLDPKFDIVSARRKEESM